MKVCVVGDTGFIASQLVRGLLADGAHVRVLAQPTSGVDSHPEAIGVGPITLRKRLAFIGSAETRNSNRDEMLKALSITPFEKRRRVYECSVS